MKNVIKIVVFFLIFVVFLYFIYKPKSGDIDRNFGENGFVELPKMYFSYYKVIDNKIYILGKSRDSSDLLLSKVNCDGKESNEFVLDSFLWSVSSGFIDKDLNIFVADNNYLKGFFISKYNKFGQKYNNGKEFIEYMGSDVRFIKEGKLYIDLDGSFFVLLNSTSKVKILKYNPDGSLDKKFGNEGIFVYNSSFFEAEALVFDREFIYIIGVNKRFSKNDNKIYGSLSIIGVTKKGKINKNFGKDGVFYHDKEFVNLYIFGDKIIFNENKFIIPSKTYDFDYKYSENLVFCINKDDKNGEFLKINNITIKQGLKLMV
ncbi:MAG: hypothetical protein ACK4GJ_04255, partial [bacterium]